MLKTTLCGVIIAISQAIRPALAWEDHVVLDAITRANPIIQAQQDLVSQHHVPGALQAVLDNTHFVARLGGVMTPLIAADDVVAAGSSKTAGVTAFGGIRCGSRCPRPRSARPWPPNKSIWPSQWTASDPRS